MYPASVHSWAQTLSELEEELTKVASSFGADSAARLGAASRLRPAALHLHHPLVAAILAVAEPLAASEEGEHGLVAVVAAIILTVGEPTVWHSR